VSLKRMRTLGEPPTGVGTGAVACGEFGSGA
jgi:hypothetical protein